MRENDEPRRIRLSSREGGLSRQAWTLHESLLPGVGGAMTVPRVTPRFELIPCREPAESISLSGFSCLPQEMSAHCVRYLWSRVRLFRADQARAQHRKSRRLTRSQ